MTPQCLNLPSPMDLDTSTIPSTRPSLEGEGGREGREEEVREGEREGGEEEVREGEREGGREGGRGEREGGEGGR